MNLILSTILYREDGIFSEIFTEDFLFLCLGLEHSYPNPNAQEGGFSVKIPAGEYLCVRIKRKLHIDSEEFETFEVTGVTGHTGILFHKGNTNKDSDGCILLGAGWGATANNGKMICDSKRAFDAFMKMQDGVESFILKVKR